MKKIKEKVKQTKTGKLSVYIYKRFFEKRPLVLFFFLVVIINLLTLFIVSFVGQKKEGIIPLHYIAGLGIDRTGQWYHIYGIPGFLFLITIINFTIAKFLKIKDELYASYFLVAATIILQLFGVLASFLIVSIV